MIENFLRRPRGVGEVVADMIRATGIGSILVATIWFGLTDAGVLAFALPGLFVPRLVGVRPWLDIAYGATLLVAAWSNVFDLYTSIAWWDLAVHFACSGVVAAMTYLLLARARIVAVPRSAGFSAAGAVLITSLLGLALSSLWEMVEWFGHAFISDTIVVGYNDTIADMAVGGAGAVCAGFAVAFLPLLSRDASDEEMAPDDTAVGESGLR